MAKSRTRRELEHSVGQTLGREMGARTVLFHQALADFAGIAVTDMKCLDYIDRSADVTAGDLARLTGLTTGAITAAIDRLERAKLAFRERSETDRRKVFIRPSKSAKMEALLPVYASLSRRMQELVAQYSTVELEAIQSFMLECTRILGEQTEKVVKMSQHRGADSAC